MAKSHSSRLPVDRNLLIRLFSKIKVSTTRFYKDVPCWEWTACLHKGYGYVGYKGQAQAAYRVMYQLFVKIIPQGFHCDHLCRNPPCVNPAHLEAVSEKVNRLRSRCASTLNAKKKFCKRGHEFTPENTIWIKNGQGRNCRMCNKLAGDARTKALADARPPREKPKFCIHGHEFSGDNIMVNKKGWYQCKSCHSIRENERHRKLMELPFDHPRRAQQRATQRRADAKRNRKNIVE